MDVRSLFAAQNYAASRPATEPKPEPSEPSGVIGSLAYDFSETLRQAEETAQQSMIGEADPHALVQALAQTELAVETAVTVRDKVVAAYQEILRMPV